MDYSEKWGVSVEEAVKLALMDLKVSRDEVTVTVLEEPSRGFFGIGAKLALIRVEKKVQEQPAKPAVPERAEKAEFKREDRRNERKQERPERKERPNRQEKPARAEKPAEEELTKAEAAAPAENAAAEEAVKTERPQRSRNRNRNRGDKEREREPKADHEPVTGERPADLTVVTDHVAITFLKDVINAMGIELDMTCSMNDEVIYIDLSGKGSGTIIGKRGQTLDAIQYLTSLVVNKHEDNKYMRVVIDAENYRAKREKTLEQLANRLADKVVRTRKSVRLEPMNPYERKVIHAALQNNPNVTTKSEGEEPYRRVVIEINQ